LVVNSSGAISVKKPNEPKFIPKTGISSIPNSLEQLNIVPSPPIAITKSQFEDKYLSE
jgi:hypothetical protein